MQISIIEKTPELKGKSSFSKEDLAKYFPQNYLIDKNTVLSWNTNADKYTNNDGSITMGG